MPYDTGDRKDVRRAEKDAESLERERIAFLHASLATRAGRVWFWALLSDCHVFNTPFTGEPIREAFLKGECNVGQRVLADITTHCPEQFIQMMREAAVKEQIDGQRNDDNYNDRNAGKPVGVLTDDDGDGDDSNN